MAVDELAAGLGCDTQAVRLAISELVGNAVIHAYSGRGAGDVLVMARVLRGRLVVTVADRGRGIAPSVDSPGLGLGLPLVSQLAEDVRIDSDEAGAAVSVSFECEGARGKGFAAGRGIGKHLRDELERAREAMRHQCVGWRWGEPALTTR